MCALVLLGTHPANVRSTFACHTLGDHTERKMGGLKARTSQGTDQTELILPSATMPARRMTHYFGKRKRAGTTYGPAKRSRVAVIPRRAAGNTTVTNRDPEMVYRAVRSLTLTNGTTEAQQALILDNILTPQQKVLFGSFGQAMLKYIVLKLIAVRSAAGGGPGVPLGACAFGIIDAQTQGPAAGPDISQLLDRVPGANTFSLGSVTYNMKQPKFLYKPLTTEEKSLQGTTDFLARTWGQELLAVGNSFTNDVVFDFEVYVKVHHKRN